MVNSHFIILFLFLYLISFINGQFTETEFPGQTQTSFASGFTPQSTEAPTPQPSLGPFPDTILDDTYPRFQYSPSDIWIAANLSTPCDIYSCIGNPSTTLTYNKTWHEVTSTGIHDVPPKITLTFQGQNYGAVSFLTPINQPFPEDITFLYNISLDGSVVTTYNLTLPRFGEVGTQPPNYVWAPTVVFITFPDSGSHILEIDVEQGPMLFDQFQFFSANSTQSIPGAAAASSGSEGSTIPITNGSASSTSVSDKNSSSTTNSNSSSNSNGCVAPVNIPYFAIALSTILGTTIVIANVVEAGGFASGEDVVAGSAAAVEAVIEHAGEHAAVQGRREDVRKLCQRVQKHVSRIPGPPGDGVKEAIADLEEVIVDLHIQFHQGCDQPWRDSLKNSRRLRRSCGFGWVSSVWQVPVLYLLNQAVLIDILHAGP
ncbi:hypothetical protein Clacol_005704 [Clathrus columnatus]|uniref:Uncharacterized protein n=1 Tax=Clathrus columnatus TaxID=1419009 RepID=A0AAV5AER6_9AGAM|nr:hypothetical protein Clacol_005704 [Clathrus columnatus]